MAALQGAMGALSISAPGATASTSAFWGNPLATYSAAPSGVIDSCRLRLLPSLIPLFLSAGEAALHFIFAKTMLPCIGV
jgi:hypothetical protein